MRFRSTRVVPGNDAALVYLTQGYLCIKASAVVKRAWPWVSIESVSVKSSYGAGHVLNKVHSDDQVPLIPPDSPDPLRCPSDFFRFAPIPLQSPPVPLRFPSDSPPIPL